MQDFKEVWSFLFILGRGNGLCAFNTPELNIQCWASYSKNVIYYSLLVTPFKSNIVTYLLLSGNSN